MAFRKVGSLATLTPGTLTQVEVGDQTVALCNVAGQVHALDGICPHAGGPLGQGALHGTTLVCPWHAWEYDCVTGEHDRNPDIKLQKFPVKIAGTDILIDIS
ncbi:MAG: Rieske (2Fe-2S) protein [Acidobacteriota bacterium]